MRSIQGFVRRWKHWYCVLHCRKGFGRAGMLPNHAPLQLIHQMFTQEPHL